DNGEEVVIFDENIVEEGSRKWANTVCGYFVGCNMSPAELRYNIRRMWGKFGVYDIISNGNGKPLVTDEITASMCHKGTGRATYARVMIEIDVVKGYKDSIEIQYKDKNDLFGHSNSNYPKNRVNNATQNLRTKAQRKHDEEGFIEIKGRKSGGNGNGSQKNQEMNNKMANEKGKVNMQFKYRPKENARKTQNNADSGNQKNEEQLKTPKQVNNMENGSPSKKMWNVGTKNVEELKRSANSYVVLTDDEGNEEIDISFEKMLTDDEANEMIKLVTDEEIKDAIFDIESNKASGHDRYTSRFFKKAWKVIGNEVCLDVKDFFINGKLLGEVKTTTIALIPKTEVSNKVFEFRPIACKFKYHYRRKEIKLSNMCFADDLLILCNGDAESVEVDGIVANASGDLTTIRVKNEFNKCEYGLRSLV
nr:RNA-directed DNA polymerase, eukaryota, reverse transcriptase zinc-binding domain protein [Tanacetum cinerariifolium]